MMENERNLFPERLKEAIGDESVRSFAQRSGLSASVVAKYLRGESEPTRLNLIAMANIAGVSLLWLASGEGGKRENPADENAENYDFHQPTKSLLKFIAELDDFGLGEMCGAYRTALRIIEDNYEYRKKLELP